MSRSLLEIVALRRQACRRPLLWLLPLGEDLPQLPPPLGQLAR